MRFLWTMVDVNGSYVGTGTAYDQYHLAEQVRALLAGLPNIDVIASPQARGLNLIVTLDPNPHR